SSVNTASTEHQPKEHSGNRTLAQRPQLPQREQNTGSGNTGTTVVTEHQPREHSSHIGNRPPAQ
ncbi:MAG: hypothetical protein ACK56I_03375, partial [bacterium]